jgi:hypothetical protein
MRRCNNQRLRVSNTCSLDAGIDLLFALAPTLLSICAARVIRLGYRCPDSCPSLPDCEHHARFRRFFGLPGVHLSALSNRYAVVEFRRVGIASFRAFHWVRFAVS